MYESCIFMSFNFTFALCKFHVSWGLCHPSMLIYYYWIFLKELELHLETMSKYVMDFKHICAALCWDIEKWLISNPNITMHIVLRYDYVCMHVYTICSSKVAMVNLIKLCFRSLLSPFKRWFTWSKNLAWHQINMQFDINNHNLVLTTNFTQF